MDFLWIDFLCLYFMTFHQDVLSSSCTTYDTLSGEIKRSSAYVLPPGESAICDKYLDVKWYRINSSVGNDIAQKCQPMTHCGTVYPLWMNGTLPLVSDGEVDRTVCQRGISGCCENSLTIKVRNCGTFYVYFLRKPSGCPISYCFGTENVNSTAATTVQTTDTYTTDFLPSTAKSNESSKNIVKDVDSDSKNLEIVGIVLGVVLAVLIFFIVTVLCIWIRPKLSRKKQPRVGPAPLHVHDNRPNEGENYIPPTVSENVSSTPEIQNQGFEQNIQQNHNREDTVLSMSNVFPSILPIIEPARKRIRK